MAEVNLMHTSEEDDRRTYSVDELVEGASGIVVAEQSATGNWRFSFEGPEHFSSDDQAACVQAVNEHLGS